MNLGMKFGLGMVGFTDADCAAIDAALPHAQRLLDAEKEFGALYDKYRADIAAVIPAAKIVLAKVKEGP
jgi:hypothetical protein